MKTLLILLLISSQLFSQNCFEYNPYKEKLLNEQSKIQAYAGMGILILTFAGQHFIKDNHARDVIITTGISAGFTININAFYKKRKIRKRFHHKNRSYKFKN